VAHAAPENRYRVDLRELRFVLFELLKFEEVLGQGPYAAWGKDEANILIDEIVKFVNEHTGPYNAIGDQVGCTLENGKVTTPPGFKEAWKALFAAGWRTLSAPEEFGGQGAPQALNAVVEEIICGSNTSFSMYPGLTYGSAELIMEFGTPEQKQRFLHKMMDGTWGGTMCLTEPQAGSDVGASATTAKKLADGSYQISGTKMFISAGDHDLTDNIIHLVLARIDGAPPGTKGLSLFVVPKVRVNADGSLGASNDVITAGIEHKMGINGSVTALLNFGENGGCVGELVGNIENVGMSQMFHMMNSARIGVALQSLGVASTAYLNALDYSRERKQGPHFSKWKDATAPRVAIWQHPDVRRMLVDMKSKVEGLRALIYKLAMHRDRAEILAGKDDKAAAYHRGQIELLVPIVKAYGSDQAFLITQTAVQTMGGAGYLRDYPVEQYCRDSKIFSIYEGTNHIQAMDLVGRKLAQAGGENFRNFLGDIGKFVAANSSHADIGPEVAQLAKASEALAGTAMKFMGWVQGTKFALIPLASTRFLEAMAEVTLSWLLLDSARIALEAKAKLPEGHGDTAFYDGKLHSARYFARNVLPGVIMKATVLQAEDDSAMTIPDDGFATV
jgi:alkylation response protein AidB-like acyl-CoA dehydrogenase